MGFKITFNWALQIDCKDSVEQGKEYEFSKDSNRSYPINIPIDLINLDRDAIAKIKILEFTNTEGKTTGKYKVLKSYSGEEKKILSKYWRENK